MMTPAEQTQTRLELPRTLVNQLLHIAQSNPDNIRWGLVGSNGKTPVHCYPMTQLNEEQIETARQTLEQRGERMFAIYRADPGQAPMPNVGEFATLTITVPFLLLGISLGTKGVLQLQAWHIDGQQLTTLDVGISET